MDAITTYLQQFGRGYTAKDKEVESSDWRRILREAGVDPDEAFEKVVNELTALLEEEEQNLKLMLDNKTTKEYN